MDLPDTTLEIQTLGRFRISINGKTVATDWPDETLKIFFCSLLSPLDLYVSWDRICRSKWGAPETRAGRRQLEAICVSPVNSFLVKELGFNPLIIGHEGIRIDHRDIHVDAFEFYITVLEALRLMSFNNHAAALEKLNRAKSLYAGGYLPGMPGKIIASTRKDLESLYRTAVMGTIPHTRDAFGSGVPET